MTSTDIASAEQRRPTTTIERAGLTPRVRSACEAMVWDALPFDEAAIAAGLSVRAMRLALAKPAVAQYLKQQAQVLRGSEGPRSIHRIRQIRDAAENKPALDAAMWFVNEDQQQQGRNAQLTASPGVTIRVVTVVQQQPQGGEPVRQTPLITQYNSAQVPSYPQTDPQVASAGNHVQPSDVTPALPQSAPRGGRGENEPPKPRS